MKIPFFLVVGATLLLTSCTATNYVTPQVSKEESTKSPTSYTLAEVSTHSTKDDCWLALDDGVYNVTSFIPNHPGGEKILGGCGKDATQMFSKHPESARILREKFKIGTLIQ